MVKVKINLKKILCGVAILVVITSFIFAKAGITDEITEDLTKNTVETVEVCFNGLLENMAGVFNPSLNLFYNLTSGNANRESLFDGNNALDFTAGESSFMKYFRSFSTYGGITIATLLWAWSLVFYMFNGKLVDTKDNPIRCTLLYITALLMIYYNADIMNYFLETAQVVWTKVVNEGNTINIAGQRGGFGAGSYFAILGGTGLASLVSGTSISILGVAMSGSPIVICLLVLIGLYLIWLLFKGFLRLWLEMAERYLVACLMVFFFPLVCGFIISKDTLVIFKSFIRMLCAQLFLIVTGFVFIKGYSVLLNTNAHLTLIGFIFVMAYLRTAQRIDSYMASMGLNVAQTGGGLMDSFGMALHSIGATVKGANNLRKGTANIVKGHAIGTGNKELYNKAAKIGASINDLGKVGQVGGLRNFGSDLQFAMQSGLNGQKLEKGALEPKAVQQAVSNFMKNPSRESQATVAALHRDDIAQALQANKAIPEGISVSNVTANRNGTFGIEGKTESGYDMKGLISNNPINENSIETGYGDDTSYFTAKNTANPGEVFEVGNASDLEEALITTGHAGVIGNEDIKTMDDYNQAVEDDNTKLQGELEKGGITEGLYQSDFGTQCVTGENCEYGEGIPIALITPDGDIMKYDRASEDMAISSEDLSPENRTSAFFGRSYEDKNSYDRSALPNIETAMNSLPEDVKNEMGYKDGMSLAEANGGFGVKADYVYEPNAGAHLKVDYGNYDFSKSQLNGAYSEWKVAPNATPQKEGYGAQSIEVINTNTKETGKMYMKNVAVHGYGRSNDRVLTAKDGNTYSASIVVNKGTPKTSKTSKKKKK